LIDNRLTLRTIRKYSWRLIVALGVFIFFQITTATSVAEILSWQLEDEVFLYFTVTVVMIIWEVSSRVIDSFDRIVLCRKFSPMSELQLTPIHCSHIETPFPDTNQPGVSSRFLVDLNIQDYRRNLPARSDGEKLDRFLPVFSISLA